jgi:hypothetical protein
MRSCPHRLRRRRYIPKPRVAQRTLGNEPSATREPQRGSTRLSSIRISKFGRRQHWRSTMNPRPVVWRHSIRGPLWNPVGVPLHWLSPTSVRCATLGFGIQRLRRKKSCNDVEPVGVRIMGSRHAFMPRVRAMRACGRVHTVYAEGVPTDPRSYHGFAPCIHAVVSTPFTPKALHSKA